MDENAKQKLEELFRHYSNAENFGNGRFVDKVIQQTLMNRAKQYDWNTMNMIGETVIPSISDI